MVVPAPAHACMVRSSRSEHASKDTNDVHLCTSKIMEHLPDSCNELMQTSMWEWVCEQLAWAHRMQLLRHHILLLLVMLLLLAASLARVLQRHVRLRQGHVLRVLRQGLLQGSTPVAGACCRAGDSCCCGSCRHVVAEGEVCFGLVSAVEPACSS